MGRDQFLNAKRLLSLIACSLIFPLTAGNIHVGKGLSINTITDALQTAGAGDSIIVHPGTYREVVVISFPVVLMGIGDPVIDGNQQGDVVSVFADSVFMEGFVIVNSGRSSLTDYAGLKINKGYRGIVVNNNQFTDNSIGIFVQDAEDCRITNNRIKTSIGESSLMGNAIHCWKCKNLEIGKNHIRSHRDGIYLEFVSNSLVRDNDVAKCLRYGLHFMFSNEDEYLYNRFSENGAGVAVMFSSRINMLHNTFDNNKGGASYGLLLKDISHGNIASNQFTGNTVGILMDGGLSLSLQENIFSGNGWAIRLMSSSTENTFTMNNFLGNTFDITTNGTSEKNFFSENYWDKYRGYDLDRDGIGDVPYHPLSLFAVISEYTPAAMLFFRSFLVDLLEQAERIIPTVTPRNFVDDKPSMKPYTL